MDSALQTQLQHGQPRVPIFVVDEEYLAGTNEKVLYYTSTDVNKVETIANNLQIEKASIDICYTFDDLLNHLETNIIDVVIIDNSINLQEINYIVRWAKIFKPEIQINHTICQSA